MTESVLEHTPGSANSAARLDESGCAAVVDARGRIHDHRAHILPMASPDCVFANSSGAVVIPARSLHRVLEVALELESQDSLFMKEIRTEEVPL
ncbi:hypothetical protein ABZ468_12275 [Streptomyces sp. NPDC005708]|uniref:hypothetical protein n=1 Tax=unclassified Streptomyces TaxID=2593676 RepID=UPI00340F133B